MDRDDRTASLDEAYRARALPEFIERLREVTPTAEKLRAVIARPTSTAILGREPSAA